MKELKKYPPKLFHSTDAKDAFKIATSTKFSSLILPNQVSTDPIFNPFYNLFESTGKKQFYGHLARNNPIHEILVKNKKQECQLIFNAADVYISPTCYKQKQLTHNVVPTWNYVTALFRGTIEMVPKEDIYNLLSRQVEIFESEVGSQWRLGDSEPEYVQKLVKGIFGIKIEVKHWMAHMKLSQNKTHERENIKQWTGKQEKTRKTALSWMDEFK